jgi:arabinan endo-1,5-alpha-L-arabinosidase
MPPFYTSPCRPRTSPFPKRLKPSKGLWTWTMVLFSSLTWAQTAPDPYVSPLKGDLGIHDPVLIKEGKTYYTYATGNGIAIKTSPDRITWKSAGSAIKTVPSWQAAAVPANTGLNYWAPDLSFRDGKYYMYYSISTGGKKVSAIGLATNTTLDATATGYAWKDEGLVVQTGSSTDYNAIDPNFIADETGTPWLAFGSWWQGLRLVKLNPTTGKPATNPAQLITIANRAGKGIEAAFIVRLKGFYFLFASFDDCCKGVNSTYNIRVGRSSSVQGPYVDQSGKSMVDGGGTLLDDGDSRWKGPGHNAIFTEGDTTFMVNHAYDAENNGASMLQIRPLYWTADNWPTLEAKKGVSLLPKQKEKARNLSGNQLRPVLFPTIAFPSLENGGREASRDGLGRNCGKFDFDLTRP